MGRDEILLAGTADQARVRIDLARGLEEGGCGDLNVLDVLRQFAPFWDGVARFRIRGVELSPYDLGRWHCEQVRKLAEGVDAEPPAGSARFEPFTLETARSHAMSILKFTLWEGEIYDIAVEGAAAECGVSERSIGESADLLPCVNTVFARVQDAVVAKWAELAMAYSGKMQVEQALQQVGQESFDILRSTAQSAAGLLTGSYLSSEVLARLFGGRARVRSVAGGLG